MVRPFPPHRRPPAARLRLRGLLDTLTATALLAGLIVVAVRLAGGPRHASDEAVYDGPFRIVDGDTLAQGPVRLRLAGIDAPELAQVCGVEERPMPCGRRARAALAALMEPGGVHCRGEGHDVYGRVLATCTSKDGDVATALVAAGMALADGCCRAEEDKARAERRGIWAAPFEHPAVWRRMHPLHGEDAD